MKRINEFLLRHGLRIRNNPCISPDFCLDWEGLSSDLRAGKVSCHALSRFRTAAGEWKLAENEAGDVAWILTPADETQEAALSGASTKLEDGRIGFPATWEHLLEMKNLVQEFDPDSAIFPIANDRLGKSTIGIGARFTTLHWPGVDWAMAHLGTGFTANQNSIPRELVYDVESMLDDQLDRVPFPFIGTDVPEGHQGQSVEGMSHGCVLEKLRSGFHLHRIPWSFNADHQPIGGKYDSREDALVAGCLLASYITFDLSPELAQTAVPDSAEARAAYVQLEIDPALSQHVKERVAAIGLELEEDLFNELLCRVWPAMKKMRMRDRKYREIRQSHFTTPTGRAYLRELSIDELPGLTSRETTAVMLALCEAMEMPVNFVAPAFGFQKNAPYEDGEKLRELVEAQWSVCEPMGVSIGFHSGSGKSAANYRLLGEVTRGSLEIKTSGRYTYELGVALAESSDPGDQQLWRDWYQFTVELAVTGAFSDDRTEQAMARSFIENSLTAAGSPEAGVSIYSSPEACRKVLQSLKPSPQHMFWFEYNFLFVLAAGGRPDKASLGDHSPQGYEQRRRFYSISPEGRFRYARNVAKYILFLAETTGLVAADRCKSARAELEQISGWKEFVQSIAPHQG